MLNAAMFLGVHRYMEIYNIPTFVRNNVYIYVYIYNI